MDDNMERNVPHIGGIHPDTAGVAFVVLGITRLLIKNGTISENAIAELFGSLEDSVGKIEFTPGNEEQKQRVLDVIRWLRPSTPESLV